MYSSVVLDAPVELNKSCSSPEDTLQKQLEEMQKDIEEMTKTQNEAEQAMNVTAKRKKNKLAYLHQLISVLYKGIWAFEKKEVIIVIVIIERPSNLKFDKRYYCKR